MKRIRVEEQYCIGCRLCEIHCLVAHSRMGRAHGVGTRPSSVARRIVKAYKGEFPRAEPRLLVEEWGHLSFAVQCRHCEDAPCIDACIAGAIERSPEGAVLADEERCVGCWMCILVCPYGVIRRSQRKIASKCDLCLGEEVPACVAHCPNEALTLIDE